MAAKDFFQVLSAKAGFAGEYEALIESEFAAASGAAYSPPEEGVFRRINVSRVIQLLCDSPVYVETFQSSAAELRVPSGTTGSTNDAEDGRFYFIRNAASATGLLTIADQSGTSLGTLNVGKLAIVLHGENDNWDVFTNINSSGDKSRIRYTSNGGVTGSGTRYLGTANGVFVSSAGDFSIENLILHGISINVDSTDGSRTFTVQVLTSPSTSPTVIASLTLPLSTRMASTTSLAVAIPSGTEIGVRVIRATGSGSSSFNDMVVNLLVSSA